MFWFHGCPRCLEGDLFDSGEMNGNAIVCLRCGHYLTEKETADLLSTCLNGLLATPGRMTDSARAILGKAS